MLEVAVHVSCIDPGMSARFPPDFKLNKPAVAQIVCPTVFYSKISKIRTLTGACSGSDAELQLDQPAAVNGHAVVLIHKIDELGVLEPFKELYAALCVAKKGIPASVARRFQFVIIADVASEEQLLKLEGTYQFLHRVRVQDESAASSSLSEELPEVEIEPEKLRARQSELLEQLYKAKEQFRDVENIEFPPTNESMTEVTPDSAPDVEEQALVKAKKVNVLEQPARAAIPTRDELSQTEEVPEAEFVPTGAQNSGTSPAKASLLPQSLIETGPDVISPQPRMIDSQAEEIDMLRAGEISDAEIDAMMRVNQQVQRELEQKKRRISTKKVQSVENFMNPDEEFVKEDIAAESQNVSARNETSSPDELLDAKDRMPSENYENSPVSQHNTAKETRQAREEPETALPREETENRRESSPDRRNSGSESGSPQSVASRKRNETASFTKKTESEDRELRESVQKLKREFEQFGQRETSKFDNSPFSDAHRQRESAQFVANSSVHAEARFSPEEIGNSARNAARKSAITFDFKTKDINPRYLVYLVEVEQLLKRHRIIYERRPANVPEQVPTSKFAAQRVAQLSAAPRMAYALDASYRAAYVRNGSFIAASAISGHQSTVGGAEAINTATMPPGSEYAFAGFTADEERSLHALNQLGSYLEGQAAQREQSLLSQSALNQQEAPESAPTQRKTLSCESRVPETANPAKSPDLSPIPAPKREPASENAKNVSPARALRESGALDEVCELRRQIKHVKREVVQIHLGLLDEARRAPRGPSGPNLVARARECRRSIWEIRDAM